MNAGFRSVTLPGAGVTAVLGPTNTGKTHLAIERMCAHASGMIGFPLRLLAREVYDRVVAAKGVGAVGLITGEEKILPDSARYLLCTVESMPQDRDVAFVAVDEGQVAADPERGHVFTDRILGRRGYAETMILGSETLRPLIRKLLPGAEIVGRPRFSTLSYAAPRKLSRLPRRSAIVAFAANEVYAIAEMLRRQKGGAAVVMGALSPRTRNAQVALYQSGEVDYIVATDAIGMGLNMDIAHVAFAALSKFDGRRARRLSPAELAQIAGRAGRYQRDGEFGMVQIGESAAGFTPEEIAAIEEHRFAPLTQLVWRNAELDFASLARLIGSLDERAPRAELIRADDAVDFAVLRSLANEPWVRERAHGRDRLKRLWAACQLPDYRKTGTEQHARLVGRAFRHLSEGNGRLPAAWIASEVAALDNVSGDIATLADRIAAARTWTYVAHRPDWLDTPVEWAERTRAVEDKLSDALHQRLTQRFVDRRTSVLLRDLKARGHEEHVEVDPDGAVAVEGELIGTLSGFRFLPDPTARAGERKLLLAAAERYLPRELARRAKALAAAPDGAFALAFDGRLPPRLLWTAGAAVPASVAKLRPGRDALNPRIEFDRSAEVLPVDLRRASAARLETWFTATRDARLAPLARLTALRPELSPAARGLVVQLVEMMGCLARGAVGAQLAALTRDDRRLLGQAGVRIAEAHVYLPALLRPEATRWRLALWGVAQGPALKFDALPPPPSPGRVTIDIDSAAPPAFYDVAGFWPVGAQAVRIDMVDRLARTLHEARDGREPFVPDAALMAGVGMTRDGFAALLRTLGYRVRTDDGVQRFAWTGARPGRRTPAVRPATSAGSPFAGLLDLHGIGRRGGRGGE